MKALKIQRDFFATQVTKDVSFRKAALKRLQKEIIAREDDIAQAIYNDFKKPKFETLAAETQFVLAELKQLLKNINHWAVPERKSASLMNWPSSDWIYKEPYGAVLIIAPWNYPFQLAFAPMIAAVAAGNTVVVKPSEVTPHTATIISEIIVAVFKPEHVSVVEGGVEVSQKLLKEKWDYIFFTGSTRVGQIVYEAAAKHLTPVTLELGGKNPTIVDKTASINLAAKRIAWGKFLNAGQTCIATDYILVHEDVKDQLVAALIQNIGKCYGEHIENSPDFSRTVSKSHYKGLKEMLTGQEILFGGDSNDEDNYLSPTIVNEPKLDSKLMQGEIFGPILPIIAYANEADIDRHITNYGKPLATYIFSNRKSFQKKIINRYSFGGGAINDTIIQITNKNLPFGGVGASGIGAYHGKRSFDLFSHQKAIIKKANWVDAPLRYPPYNLPMKLVKIIKYLF
ncbi:MULTISPECIES: aldehyde dehydrogenase [unclassified Arenibacter]|uniref:aldehyde dehydrogenase n=1 Tax=unclassified Arenibacter TaxID=2615047 RepID=UPI000E34E0F7|nr:MULTISPECIES: aldehyde dehydrogenase [unclassified Arenibacter]MCM4164741.1 aldehyde dehydrogenase [Arenibacter sp. A80]RFT55811.1 aldehyde dehydrogenase [Arenibacter sp. P308M17]